MNLSVALSLLLLSVSQLASAVQPRCGHDAFGNVVCMDRDGVLSTQPIKSKQQGKTTEPKSGVNDTAEEKRIRESGHEADTPAVRCGTDPFGNTVCR
ncbi:MAG: hypothetical protein FD121_1421 [Gallionellaceae bacterium]|nr:MAG: hypothetical protein FD121_1421 [Gallionellaceae bacterium]